MFDPRKKKVKRFSMVFVVIATLFLLGGCDGTKNLGDFSNLNLFDGNQLTRKITGQSAAIEGQKPSEENATQEETQSVENLPPEENPENQEEKGEEAAKDDTQSSIEENITEESPEEQLEENIPAKRTSNLMIGITADAHSSPEKGFWMISMFAQKMKVKQPDFIIQLGDLIENRIGYAPKKRKEGLADFRRADANFLGFTPRYHVIGNHEMINLSKGDFENLIGRNNYYSFLEGDFQIIVLDTMYKCGGEAIEADKEKPGAYVGCLTPNQLDWLKGKLRNKSKNIIFVHHPLYNLRNREEVGEILKKYNDNIVLIVSGHKHKAGIFKYQGIRYVDMPSAQFQKQYAIVEIYGRNPVVKFYYLW